MKEVITMARMKPYKMQLINREIWSKKLEKAYNEASKTLQYGYQQWLGEYRAINPPPEDIDITHARTAKTYKINNILIKVRD